MPTVKMINFNGEEVGEFSLTDAVFGAPIHVPAMHQVVLAQLANRRLGTQAAKGKGEVSGGGKKPWRQKHTFAALDSRRSESPPEAAGFSPEGEQEGPGACNTLRSFSQGS